MILSKSTCLVLSLLSQMIIVHTHRNLVMKVHLSTHLLSCFLFCILGEVLPYMGYISMCCYKGYGVQAVKSRMDSRNQAPVVQKVDNAIQRINLYPLDSAIVCCTAYLLDSDLSRGSLYPAFEQLGTESLNL